MNNEKKFVCTPESIATVKEMFKMNCLIAQLQQQIAELKNPPIPPAVLVEVVNEDKGVEVVSTEKLN